jgi:hypothetical protein
MLLYNPDYPFTTNYVIVNRRDFGCTGFFGVAFFFSDKTSAPAISAMKKWFQKVFLSGDNHFVLVFPVNDFCGIIWNQRPLAKAALTEGFRVLICCGGAAYLSLSLTPGLIVDLPKFPELRAGSRVNNECVFADGMM